MEKFSSKSAAKLREGIFVGPQIRQVLLDRHFEVTLEPVEQNAWRDCKAAVDHISATGGIMSLKIHFLHSQLNFFTSNLGQRYHQDISQMEKNYQGIWNANMMGDFC
jgi:hypothetical protein